MHLVLKDAEVVARGVRVDVVLFLPVFAEARFHGDVADDKFADLRVIAQREIADDLVLVADVSRPFRVHVDRLSFISALRRVSVFASASSSLIKLHLDNNRLTVSAQDIEFSTSAEESVLCEYDGNPMSIGFNGPYLLEVLNNLANQEIIVELADPSRAGVLLPAEQEMGEDLIMLLMPMMLQD